MPPEALVALWLAPVLLVAALQSRRLFRIQLQDNAIHVVRRLLPLAIAASMWSFLGAALLDFADHGRQQMWTLFRETHEAIEKIQPGTPNLDAAHPLQLTAEDLAKASPLSERARRWLSGSRITVVPDKFHGGVGRGEKLPCQGSKDRFTRPRGLPKYAEVIQDILFVGWVVG